MKVLETFKEPYPCIDLEKTNWQNFIHSLLIGTFISGFLIVFQPFGISNWHSEDKWLYLIGFGLITFGILVLVKFVLVKSFPKFYKESSWTVGREISQNTLVLCLIAIGNFLYAFKIGLYPWSLQAFLSSFISVIAIGVFPIFFNVIFKYKSSSNRFDKGVQISKDKKNFKVDLTLKSENQKEELNISTDQLLYIESADNYSNIFYQDEDLIKNRLLRGSLSFFERQIDVSNITRCHRSFVVNLDKAEKVTGNAQGYKVHLEGIKTLIPVARSFSHILESRS